ncbi:hypothetical protein BMI91_10745 [Thioclava sediminum]|uniref:Uncharacterized protein n=1 Tax=Thioclava sediminum TaxID=1915319 RepID=A0ABX3N223_9RHOB|nr:hypothetical protein [Thioclava sp.]OOY02924.1 hypothetical protein BMI87_20420 [Thioclava sp. F28-4]OOY19420.1 hypothetical protein BMI86_16625 [Thioclava sp. DLFJ5-1]OOY24499.1 hypothetical protein BMI91_10745 [Thioclava sediminum]
MQQGEPRGQSGEVWIADVVLRLDRLEADEETQCLAQVEHRRRRLEARPLTGRSLFQCLG